MAELDNYAEMDTPEAWAIDIARGLNAVLRPGEAASASFAGFTAVYTNHTVVDSLGLTDAYVAGLPAVPGGPGHEKFAPREYLVSRHVLLVNPWPGRDLGAVEPPIRAAVLARRPTCFLTPLCRPLVSPKSCTREGSACGSMGACCSIVCPWTRQTPPLAWIFESGTWDGWALSGHCVWPVARPGR